MPARLVTESLVCTWPCRAAWLPFHFSTNPLALRASRTSIWRAALLGAGWHFSRCTLANLRYKASPGVQFTET